MNETRRPTTPIDHNPLNLNHHKTVLPTCDLPLISITLTMPTSENVSSRCSKHTRTCGRQADFAKYLRPNTVLNLNQERNASALCPTDKAPPCATRSQPKFERCPTPATSEWASPIVLLPKKDGSLRLCVDYRRLNAKTVANSYPLPRIDDFLDSLGDAQIFRTRNCNAGYGKVPAKRPLSQRISELIDIIAFHSNYETRPRPFNMHSISS